jgi:hypothetical protein
MSKNTYWFNEFIVYRFVNNCSYLFIGVNDKYKDSLLLPELSIVSIEKSRMLVQSYVSKFCGYNPASLDLIYMEIELM